MAQLGSPGVAVTVIDESFYTPAAPGTTPLIVVATGQDKANSAGTGTAPGTTKANAGKVYLMTSQMDLATTFGTPYFETDASNNPVHAGERNEYGLQAAYSYLGVSSRAYIVRADVDLTALAPKTTAPTGAPANGALWLDTAQSLFGIFEWNGAPLTASSTTAQKFTNKIPAVITNTDYVDAMSGAPLQSFGAIGTYAIVTTGNDKVYRLFYKNKEGMWVEVGSNEWTMSWPTVEGSAPTNAFGSGVSLTLTLSPGGASDTVSAATVAVLANEINSGLGATHGIMAEVGADGQLVIYTDGTVDEVAVSGTACVSLGIEPGNYYCPALQISPHTQVPAFKTSDSYPRPTGSIWIKATDPNLGANWTLYSYNSQTSSFKQVNSPLYANNASALAGLDKTGGGSRLAVGTTYIKFNDSSATFWEAPTNATQGTANDRQIAGLANFKLYSRSATGATTVTTKIISNSTSSTTTQLTTGAKTFSMVETLVGSQTLSSAKTISFTASGTSADATLIAGEINAAGFVNIVASVTSDKKIQISHKLGGDIYFKDGTGTPLSTLFGTPSSLQFTNLYAPDEYDQAFGPLQAGATQTFAVASNWKPTALNSSGLTVGSIPPSTEPADGQLWYNSAVSEVDIMVNNGVKWRGYKNVYPSANITVSATRPNGVNTNDLWIDTSDLENYPKIYRYNSTTTTWSLLDNSDQTTENGVVFQDARWSTAGDKATAATIDELLTSDYVDFDCPDPALYPAGMLLWNTRRSTFNVKEFKRNFIDLTARNVRNNNEQQVDYYPHRWVSVAANQENGAGTFGRKSQRAVVVQALQKLINTNQAIRDEDSVIYNLIACPGYPEAVNELVALNYDRSLASFVIADAPARLPSDATSLSNWGNNVNKATDNGDLGLVTTDPYCAFYYPWGYTSDNLGNNIVVPPSHMMLRTFALSDNVSYPWFAPAGTRRGGITNATAVGYVDAATGEFQSIALNTGQRDALTKVHVNPITYISGTGLVAYGQYTRQLAASSLDRVNVARLVVYLRRQFNQLAKPYVFEPNDTITRNEIKQAAESLLLELVGQRAIYDYVVVCDSSNNTPARIDRSELYLDVAIEPVKAAEFIYIPLRLEKTGAIKGLGQ